MPVASQATLNGGCIVHDNVLTFCPRPASRPVAASSEPGFDYVAIGDTTRTRIRIHTASLCDDNGVCDTLTDNDLLALVQKAGDHEIASSVRAFDQTVSSVTYLTVEVEVGNDGATPDSLLISAVSPKDHVVLVSTSRLGGAPTEKDRLLHREVLSWITLLEE